MQQYLDERITGEDFDLEEMLAEVAGDAVDERKQKLKWQKVAGVAAGLVILLLSAMFGLMLAANEMSKEARSVVYAPSLPRNRPGPAPERWTGIYTTYKQ